MRRIRSYLPLRTLYWRELAILMVSSSVRYPAMLKITPRSVSGRIHHQGLVHQAGLYAKSRKAMYAIALATEGFSLSAADPDIQELPVALYHPLADSLVHAA